MLGIFSRFKNSRILHHFEIYLFRVAAASYNFLHLWFATFLIMSSQVHLVESVFGQNLFLCEAAHWQSFSEKCCPHYLMWNILAEAESLVR